MSDVTSTEEKGIKLEATAMAPYSLEQQARENNPYRKISKKLNELAGRESLSAEDRSALQSLEQTFRQHSYELKTKAEFLLSQGVNPISSPRLFFDLCYDTRNEIFLPGGILIYGEFSKGKPQVTSETARLVLEDLGFVNPGESLQALSDKIDGEWKLNPNVYGNYFEKRSSNSLTRASGNVDPESGPESAMIWIENQALGAGVMAGITTTLITDANNRISIGDTITTVLIRVEGANLTETGTNLLRCAP